MIELTKIELSEKDIKLLVAERFNLDPDKTRISFSHYAGDAREAGYTNAVVEGPKLLATTATPRMHKFS